MQWVDDWQLKQKCIEKSVHQKIKSSRNLQTNIHVDEIWFQVQRKAAEL